uniref:Uncharacterized protein n=1 Tax=Anguilla anguilla TaxID=7936 RepID=A0A0E9RQ44_ANGAN
MAYVTPQQEHGGHHCPLDGAVSVAMHPACQSMSVKPKSFKMSSEELAAVHNTDL